MELFGYVTPCPQTSTIALRCRLMTPPIKIRPSDDTLAERGEGCGGSKNLAVEAL